MKTQQRAGKAGSPDNKLINMRALLAVLMIVAVSALVSGCDNSGESNFRETYVLDGWMPLGHPISVRLTHTVDVGQYYDPAAVGVTGATVTVWEVLNEDTTVHSLVADTNALEGTYTASGITATVKSGYDYSIRIEVNGDVITASTSHSPQPFTLDSVVYQQQRVENPTDPNSPQLVTYGARDSADNVVLYELFFQPATTNAGINFIIECMEPDWYDNEDLEVSGNNGPGFSNVAFWTVRQESRFAIPSIVLNFQGQYRVRAMTVDTVGYNYCMTVFPPDPEWNPPSNVSGALGLFTVYDADTTYFCLTDPEADVPFNCGQ